MAETDSPSHPIEHIDTLKAYEWMLSQCAAADAQRQAREDGLVGTITQISSAAILAVPGVMFASNTAVPNFLSAPLLYAGLLCFGAALFSAMVEQHFSSLAYAKHVEVLHAYYTKSSTETEDKPSRRRARIARRTSYAVFSAALLLTTVGLLNLKG